VARLKNWYSEEKKIYIGILTSKQGKEKDHIERRYCGLGTRIACRCKIVL
jgi:hypothetical protein